MKFWELSRLLSAWRRESTRREDGSGQRTPEGAVSVRDRGHGLRRLVAEAHRVEDDHRRKRLPAAFGMPPLSVLESKAAAACRRAENSLTITAAVTPNGFVREPLCAALLLLLILDGRIRRNGIRAVRVLSCGDAINCRPFLAAVSAFTTARP